jgi:hypothetical protein
MAARHDCSSGPGAGALHAAAATATRLHPTAAATVRSTAVDAAGCTASGPVQQWRPRRHLLLEMGVRFPNFGRTRGVFQ